MVLAEKTKISLSDKQSLKITVHGSGKSSTYEITRQQFEELTQDLMERTELLVNQVLEDAELNWKDISR
jgi:molecular chaperone DnaK